MNYQVKVKLPWYNGKFLTFDRNLCFFFFWLLFHKNFGFYFTFCLQWNCLFIKPTCLIIELAFQFMWLWWLFGSHSFNIIINLGNLKEVAMISAHEGIWNMQSCKLLFLFWSNWIWTTWKNMICMKIKKIWPFHLPYEKLKEQKGRLVVSFIYWCI